MKSRKKEWEKEKKKRKREKKKETKPTEIHRQKYRQANIDKPTPRPPKK